MQQISISHHTKKIEPCKDRCLCNQKLKTLNNKVKTFNKYMVRISGKHKLLGSKYMFIEFAENSILYGKY